MRRTYQDIIRCLFRESAFLLASGYLIIWSIRLTIAGKIILEMPTKPNEAPASGSECSWRQPDMQHTRPIDPADSGGVNGALCQYRLTQVLTVLGTLGERKLMSVTELAALPETR